MDVEVTRNEIVHNLIAGGPQNQEDLGPLVNSNDAKEREEEVDLYVRVCTMLDDDVGAYVEE